MTFPTLTLTPSKVTGKDPRINNLAAAPQLKYFSRESLPTTTSYTIHQPVRRKRWVCTEERNNIFGDIFGEDFEDHAKEAACDMIAHAHELRPMNQPVLSIANKGGPQLPSPLRPGVTLISSAKVETASGDTFKDILNSSVCGPQHLLRIRRQTTPTLTLPGAACNTDGSFTSGAEALVNLVEHATGDELTQLAQLLGNAISEVVDPLTAPTEPMNTSLFDDIDLGDWYQVIDHHYPTGLTDVVTAENFLNATSVPTDQQAIAHGAAGDILAQATAQLDLQPYITADTAPSTQNLTGTDISPSNEVAARCDYLVDQLEASTSTSHTNPHQECARLALQAQGVTSGAAPVLVVVVSQTEDPDSAESRKILNNYRANIVRTHLLRSNPVNPGMQNQRSLALITRQLEQSIAAAALDHATTEHNFGYIFIGGGSANSPYEFSDRFYSALGASTTTFARRLRSSWNAVGVTSQSHIVRGLMSLVASRAADFYHDRLVHHGLFDNMLSKTT